MTYCNICNMIVINVAWYIEQTVSEIKKTVEDCMKNTPNLEKKHYTYVNGKIKEEEGLILDDGASHTEAKLVANERALLHTLAVCKEIGGIQDLVAMIFIDGAMKVVGASLAHHVDDAPGSASILGTVGILFDLELLDSFPTQKIP